MLNKIVRVEDKIYCGRCNLLLDVLVCFPRVLLLFVSWRHDEALLQSSGNRLILAINDLLTVLWASS